MPGLLDAGIELRPDPARVAAGLFLPGESTPGAESRAGQVIARMLALPSEQLDAAARRVVAEFGSRHAGLSALLHENAGKVDAGALGGSLSLLLGAAFTAEYAVEGAALCNPSAVPHPDQSGLPSGSLRLAVALRSIGEGHVSSISFCTAIIGPGRSFAFERRELPIVSPVIADGEWDTADLRRALEVDGQLSEIAHAITQKLPARVRSADVERAIGELPVELFNHYDARARVEAIRLVERSAYDAEFPADSALSQRVLLPVADEERRGLEDARFTRFVEDDGTVEYRASYTAYDGRAIASRLLVTSDFERFSIRRLIGTPTRTKGMAFFPRRVGGRLLALTRSDGESILLARSEDGLEWGEETLVAAPDRLWEVVQSGNCGAPMETDRGWLVLTHGVGPMRRYSIGAMLLHLDDPGRVIARLEAPLLEPLGALQDGYVPNVVYSCGGVIHDGTLWMPHGVGDGHIRVVSIPVDELLDAMSPFPTPFAGGAGYR